MKKNIVFILVTVIIIVVCMTGTYLLQGFAIPNHSSVVSGKIFNAFYNEDKNSLDGVYIGPSGANRYWIPPVAFNEQGIAVSLISTPKQPFVFTKYMMQEAKKTQDPDLFIIELILSCQDANYTTEENVRYTTDNLKPSLLRLKATNAALKNMSYGDNKVNGNILTVYFPALESFKRKVQGKLTKDVNFKVTEEENPVKGYRLDSLTFRQKELDGSDYTPNHVADMAPETEELLIDLLDYCDSIDNEVVFVLSPYAATEKNYPILNTATKIVTSRGYDVINFNTEENLEIIDVNWKTDYYNWLHMNCLGAEKYTSYLAEYLKVNYNLEDHRSDPEYSTWHKSYDDYLELTTEGKLKMVTE